MDRSDGANGRSGSDSDGHCLLRDWEIETGKRILPPPDANIMPFEEASGHTIHTIASGPGFPEDLIHRALLTAAYAAKEHLIMTTPTLCPATTFCMPSVPPSAASMSASSCRAKNDSLLVGWASRAFFTELLAAGVKIYQFEGGLLHTKSVLVDGELSLQWAPLTSICAACGSTSRLRW